MSCRTFSWLTALLLAALSLVQTALATEQARTRPEQARLYFISPHHGERLSGPVHIRFGLSGMGVAPAGSNLPDTGHHHLLIDTPQLPDLNLPLPATDQIVHFGKGQTETVLQLGPGVHRLQLILGDYLHRPHQPAVISEPITIEVIAPAE